MAVEASAPMPPEAPRAPAASAPWRPKGAMAILSSLAPAVVLAGASASSPVLVSPGGLSLRVEGEFLTRLEGLLAYTGQLRFQPEMKRFRGRATDKPFGEGPSRMVRAMGQGTLHFAEPPSRSFFPIDIGEASAYFREDCVFAFEEAVVFENGRVPSEAAPDLDLVHLRGQGTVLLSLSGALRSVVVRVGGLTTVRLSHLVGWVGHLTPHVLALLPATGGESPPAAVELSGEGFALIALPVR